MQNAKKGVGTAIALLTMICLFARAEDPSNAPRGDAVRLVETGLASAKNFEVIRILELSNSEIVSPNFFLNSEPVAALPHAGLRLAGSFKTSKLENTLYTSSLVSMVALNVADYFSTREALKYKGIQEGNPLMKPFVKNAFAFAAVKAGMTAVSYWGMKALFKKNKKVAWVLSAVSNIALGYVVSNNLRLINRMKTAGR